VRRLRGNLWITSSETRTPARTEQRRAPGRHRPGRIGVRPNVDLAATIGVCGATSVDRGLRTNLRDIYAAGGCVPTTTGTAPAALASMGHLDREAYRPLGSTAH